MKAAAAAEKAEKDQKKGAKGKGKSKGKGKAKESSAETPERKLEAAKTRARAKINGDEARNPCLVTAALTVKHPVMLIMEVIRAGDFGEYCCEARQYTGWQKKVYNRAAESARKQKKVTNLVSKVWS